MNDHWRINPQMQEHGDEFVVIQSPLLSYQLLTSEEEKRGKDVHFSTQNLHPSLPEAVDHFHSRIYHCSSPSRNWT